MYAYVYSYIPCNYTISYNTYITSTKPLVSIYIIQLMEVVCI